MRFRSLVFLISLTGLIGYGLSRSLIRSHYLTQRLIAEVQNRYGGSLAMDDATFGLRGLHASGVRWRDMTGLPRGTGIDAKHVRLQWKVLPLLRRRVAFRRIDAEGLHIVLPCSKTKAVVFDGGAVSAKGSFDEQMDGTFTAATVIAPGFSGGSLRIHWTVSGKDGRLDRPTGSLQLADLSGELLPLQRLVQTPTSGLRGLNLACWNSPCRIDKATGSAEFISGEGRVHSISMTGPQIHLEADGKVSLVSESLDLAFKVLTKDPEADVRFSLRGPMQRPRLGLTSFRQKAFRAELERVLLGLPGRSGKKRSLPNGGFNGL
jgi:hypothetical protein